MTARAFVYFKFCSSFNSYCKSTLYTLDADLIDWMDGLGISPILGHALLLSREERFYILIQSSLSIFYMLPAFCALRKLCLSLGTYSSVTPLVLRLGQ